MRRYGTTVLMAVLLLGLAGYLYWVELPTQERHERQEAEKAKLLPFDEQAISGLSLRSDLGDVKIERGEGRIWNLASPVQGEADAKEVDNMIRALVLGKVSRTVDESAKTLAPFGLEKPPVILTIQAGAQSETLSIGDAGPISSTLYVLRHSDKRVLLTDLAGKDFLNKSVMTFRRKDILRFEQNQVDRLRLTYPPTEIVLYLMNEPPAKRWKIRSPVESLADQSEVRAFLYRLADLKAMGILDPGPERTAIEPTLGKPVATLTVHAAGADQTVKFYQSNPKSGEAFAERVGSGALYRINPSSIKDLARDLFTLRDKRLLGVDLPDIAMLSVKTRETAYTLINQNNEWILEDQPTRKLSQEATELFVSRVVNLPAEKPEIKQPGALAPYGLTSPAAEFTVTSREGKMAGHLLLGNQVNGLLYARGQGLTGIYQARADILTQIPTKESLFKPTDAPGAPEPVAK